MTLLIGSRDLSWCWRSNEQEWIHYPWDVAICFRFLLTFLKLWLFRGRSYQLSRIPRLITLTETLTKPDITKTESNNCFIEHCFKENTVLIVACPDPSLTLLLEIMHCAGNVQISRLSMYHNSYYHSKQIFLSFHWPRAHHVTCK